MAYGGGLLIGTPGENVGSVIDAGAVTHQHIDCGEAQESQTFGPRTVLTQQTRGIPGVAESGDAFGASLGSGGSQEPFGEICAFLVGVPGEGIGSAATLALSHC
jgi:hypothetical protein